jgi:TolB-like protein/Tfp pilus assembly protein PilF
MKRCPECRRDYYDDTLSFCLEDGAQLVYGVSNERIVADEPATAILLEPPVVTNGSETATKVFSHTTNETEILQAEAEAEPQRRSGSFIENQSLSANRAAEPKRNRNKLFAAFGIAILLLVGFFGYRYFAAGGSKQIDSIAVMPFVNESGSPDLEYLSDGMTETLIRSLSQLPNLNVKARSSVFRYKGKEADAKTIGKDLGVQAILNGRVTQRGDQLTLDLELINAETENVIWTDEYDRKSSDIVSLQNEIARDVSNKLKLKLSGADQQKLAKNYTSDPEAYRLYLQGRFYWNKRAGKEFEKAEGYFQQAVERDPNFALGYVGLADTNEDEDRPQKKEYIRRALTLDDQLAEAHASLGYQYMMDYNWPDSERELKRAIELNPNYAPAHQWNGARLMMLGRYDDAMDSIKRALEIDPTSSGINFYYCVLLFVSGKTDESVQQFKKFAEIEPTFTWTHMWLSRIYRQTGNRAAAVEERAKAFELEGNSENARLLRENFAGGNWNGYLNEFIRLRAGQSGTHRDSSVGGASVLAELGEKEMAINELTKAAEKGDFWLFTIKTDPSFDSLGGDPRFQALVKKFDAAQ